MKQFNIGDKVKVISINDGDSEAMELYVGREGVVSSLYPSAKAPFPIYVTFSEGEAGVPFARDEVEVI